MKTKLNTLDKEKQCCEEREGRNGPRIIFHVSIVVLIVLLCWFRLYSFYVWCETPFSLLIPKRGLPLSLHHRIRSPTNFPVFSLTVFSFEFLPANLNLLSICCRYISISNLGASCYDDLKSTFLFLVRFSFFIYFSFFSLFHDGSINFTRCDTMLSIRFCVCG